LLGPLTFAEQAEALARAEGAAFRLVVPPVSGGTSGLVSIAATSAISAISISPSSFISKRRVW
jgi:hypothetical protein